MFKKIKAFFKSLFWHIARGLPKSGQKNILTRYTICLECSDFDTVDKICNQCGCNISDKNIFMNKLAWADQECPLGKWKKI